MTNAEGHAWRVVEAAQLSGVEPPKGSAWTSDWIGARNPSLNLQSGRRKGNTIRRRIYLCLSDKEHSFVAGTFTAKIVHWPE